MSHITEIERAHKENRKMISVLVDPDKTDEEGCKLVAKMAEEVGIDFLFVGSSILTRDHFSKCIRTLKQSCSVPVLIFPGNTMQVCDQADGILFLSMISGRNADLLIGKHVIAAPMIKESGLEVLPTGYMLIDSGNATSVSYMSYTFPIPHDKDDIAQCTAMAGEMLGLKLIYMDAGSGARMPISNRMVRSVRKSIDVPLIVGGGIRTLEKIREVFEAGADMVVIGNALEKDPTLMFELAAATRSIKAE